MIIAGIMFRDGTVHPCVGRVVNRRSVPWRDRADMHRHIEAIGGLEVVWVEDRATASADTHPQGGDSAQTEAPAPLSGAVPSEETADAQTPSPPTGDDNV